LRIVISPRGLQRGKSASKVVNIAAPEVMNSFADDDLAAIHILIRIIKDVIFLENELIKLASNQGIWAALSVALIFYILKTQEKRDDKQDQRGKNYQDIISKLTEKFNLVENIKKDVEEIKEHIFKK
jgi:hypothetical protein